VGLLLARSDFRDFDQVNVWMNNGHNVYWSPLLLAIQKEHVEILRRLLKDFKIDVNQCGESQILLLGLALDIRNKEILELLLSHESIDVNKFFGNWTPLGKAVDVKYVFGVQKLLEKGADESQKFKGNGLIKTTAKKMAQKSDSAEIDALFRKH
jgi:hypothetical protein